MYKKPFTVTGPAGKLEALWQQQVQQKSNLVAIICHPHPLHEGTMTNKVVTTTAKAFNRLGRATITFNFRGVGNSEGVFGDAVGEIEDCLAIVEWLFKRQPKVELWLAGFSFGSYIAAKVASKVPTAQLLSIAPPVHKYDFTNLKVDCPWLIVQGEEDEVVPASEVHSWYNELQANKELIVFPQTTHFFHGKLIELAEKIQQYYK